LYDLFLGFLGSGNLLAVEFQVLFVLNIDLDEVLPLNLPARTASESGSSM